MSKLGEYTSLVTKGTTPTTLGCEFTDSGVNFLKIESFNDDGSLNSNIAHIDEQTHAKMSRSALKEDDILISIAGNIGRIALVTKEMLPANTNQALAIVRCIDDKDREGYPVINPLFMKYYLNTDYMQFKLTHANAQSVQSNINLDNIRELEIDLPSPRKQAKIAEVLSNIDAKIGLNNSIFNDLETLAAEIYNYWFIQFDFPDKEGKPYKSSEGRMTWNEELNRNIPEGWEVAPVGKHVTDNRGISYSSDDLEGDGISMINLNSFNTDASYKSDGLKSYSGAYSKDKLIHPYDLIICATQQTAIDLSGKTNVIGKSLLVPDIFDGPIVASMDIMKLCCDEAIGKYYLRATINHPSIHKYLVGFANGTKIKHLDINGLLEMKHEIPPKPLLEKYNRIIESIERKKSEIILENKDLTALRDFLLPLLMTEQVGFEKKEA